MMKRLSDAGDRRFFRVSLSLFLCSLVISVIAAVYALPGDLFVYAEYTDTPFVSGLFNARLIADEAVTVTAAGDAPVMENIRITSSSDIEYKTAELSIDLLGLSLRSLVVKVLTDTEVVPVGLTVGIEIDTTGLMVLGTGSVNAADGTSQRPCEDMIKSGDILIKMDDTEIRNHKQFRGYIESLPKGSDVSLSIKRGGQDITVTVKCAVSAEDGMNKLGIWIRDSTKGIGTITYYNPVNSRFAALGHGVVDVDTKQLIPVKNGNLYQTNIVAVKRGKKNAPGELVGKVITDQSIGAITSNTNVGLFGDVKGFDNLPEKRYAVALQSDVHEGPAVILSNVNGHEIKQYDIYIERVNSYAADESKGMVIRITDQELITRTNGIVQGMSGCPIIQNNRLIGAVTHVFLQNPLRGYGIFIENMMKYET